MEAAKGHIIAPLQMLVRAEGEVCHLSIIGHIHEWAETNSQKISKDIKDAKGAGATKCKIYINSNGGSVFDANEILNLIEENFADEDVEVMIGALCASAATVFPSKYKATAKANSQLMIHKPMMGTHGNEDKIEAQLKLLKDLTKHYRAMYSKKLGITEDEVEALWKNDFWMNAKEAKKKGLIDKIQGDKEKIDAATHLLLVACGAPEIFAPESNNKNDEKQHKNPIKMELSVLAVQLGLPATATQEEVNAKLAALQQDAAKAQGLEAAAKTAEEAAKKAFFDKAELDKKINATTRPAYEAMAKNDFDNVKAVIEAIPAVTPISAQIPTGSTNTPEAGAVDRSKWTYADYLEAGAQVFEELEKADPAKAQALIDAHYKEA